MSEQRRIYEKLLEDGDLFEMIPSMTGDWDKDKKTFIKEYYFLQQILNDNNEYDEDGI